MLRDNVGINRYPALNSLQLKVLNWVNDGCPDGAFDDWSHRLPAGTLHEHGPLTDQGRGPTWETILTDAGKYYLDNDKRRVYEEIFLISNSTAYGCHNGRENQDC